MVHSTVFPDRSAADAIPAVRIDAQMPTAIFFNNIGIYSPRLFLWVSLITLSTSLTIIPKRPMTMMVDTTALRKMYY